MEGTKVVGIITETNLFRVFLELFGARTPGVRLTAQVEDEPGKLAQLTNAICDIGGNIIALAPTRRRLPAAAWWWSRSAG